LILSNNINGSDTKCALAIHILAYFNPCASKPARTKQMAKSPKQAFAALTSHAWSPTILSFGMIKLNSNENKPIF